MNVPREVQGYSQGPDVPQTVSTPFLPSTQAEFPAPGREWAYVWLSGVCVTCLQVYGKGK